MGTLSVQIIVIALLGFAAGWFGGAVQGYAKGVKDGRDSGWAAAWRHHTRITRENQ